MKQSVLRSIIVFLLALIALETPAVAYGVLASPASEQVYRQWIEFMKAAPSGPFFRLRFFCKDGRVLQPKSYACGRSGGYQHGEWSSLVTTLRSNGYKVANLLAGIDAEKAIAKPDFLDSYNQILIEKYLIAVDDGWIMRSARYYRGAVQVEDEHDGARRLLAAMSSKPEWSGLRFPALRVGARLLPRGNDTAEVQAVRQLATSLSEMDAGFMGLRTKIHGYPDVDDARRVRDYADRTSDLIMKDKYLELAGQLDRLYQDKVLSALLEAAADRYTAAPWLQKLLRDAAGAYTSDASALNRYRSTATLLAHLRDAIPKIISPGARLSVLDLSLEVEAENFRASSGLLEQLALADRHERVEWLGAAIDAVYGTGMINQRSRQELHRSLGGLETREVTLGAYLDVLTYIGRVPGWSSRTLRSQFYVSMQKLAEIEPLALLFIQDQLRGSPLLFYSQVLDSLQRDANNLAGIQHTLFGKAIGSGFRALNPGLARGVLHARPDRQLPDEFSPDGIYLLPETVSTLPPVAGIITAGEGNPLSHVQLLARNLGIPNISIDEDLIPVLGRHDGETVVMAVSPAGVVELVPDGETWNAVFSNTAPDQDVMIRPDIEKLDLCMKDFIDLDDLRASDSGRMVGPKAAKLGELRHYFPEAVAPGLAIPFGVFREVVLDRSYQDTQQTVFEWMVDNYRHIEQLPAGSAERWQTTERFRTELHDLVAQSRMDEKFREHLRSAMELTFGSLDDLGVFIRSDTNIEDLAGFTGAGLNLTLPNVVGFDNVVNGIADVWASPFTARAFAWRQSRMEAPEYVYPAVLLLKTVANDKSGVLVTKDIDNGDRDVLSVAVNEGVGGVVDGQSAESLRIDTRDGSVRVLATATASWRRSPAGTGGMEKLPVSGSERILQPAEIQQLIRFARELPQRFPSMTDDRGRSVAADVEYGFLDGRLYLFQVRPFLESQKAHASSYLNTMDAAIQGNLGRIVTMQEVPDG